MSASDIDFVPAHLLNFNENPTPPGRDSDNVHDINDPLFDVEDPEYGAAADTEAEAAEADTEAEAAAVDTEAEAAATDTEAEAAAADTEAEAAEADAEAEATEADAEAEATEAAITTAIIAGVANRSRDRTLVLTQYVLYLQQNYRRLFQIPRPLHYSLAGQEFMHSFIGAPETMWLDTFRMTSVSFGALLTWLMENTGFEGSRYISAQERLFVFLYMLCQGITQTAAAYLFGHSNETIYRYVFESVCSRGYSDYRLTVSHWSTSIFHQTLKAVVILARTIIRFKAEPLPSDIREDPRFSFFENCIGAVDGSHYACLPPAEDTEVYRNRKGAVTMNVMMVVNLRGRFSYIVSGWEGSAHDWKVFMSAVTNLKLAIPEGKYLLGDAGYTASHRVLTPYRGESASASVSLSLSA